MHQCNSQPVLYNFKIKKKTENYENLAINAENTVALVIIFASFDLSRFKKAIKFQKLKN